MTAEIASLLKELETEIRAKVALAGQYPHLSKPEVLAWADRLSALSREDGEGQERE